MNSYSVLQTAALHPTASRMFWLSLQGGFSPIQAFAMGVVPFLPADAVKAGIVHHAARRLR